MEGVTILSIVKNPIYGFQWNIVCTLILACTLLLLGYIFYRGIQDKDGDIMFFASLFAIIIDGILFPLVGTEQIGEYDSYKVTIDENVSFQELSKEYEVVDSEGIIYEIVNREDEEYIH